MADLTRSLSATEKARADRFVRPEDRRRFAVAHGLVRWIIARYLDAAPAALAFEADGHGKPQLHPSANPHGLVFNLSHSHDRLLLGLAWRRQLGVDVEKVRPDIATPELARHTFAERECNDWLALPAEQRALAFFTTWTRKEAYLKALGLGLQVPLRDFTVAVAPSEFSHITQRWSGDTEAADWSVWTRFPAPGYIATAVVAGTRLRPVVQCWQAPGPGA